MFNPYVKRSSAVVAVLTGIVIVNVFVLVLSEPKSNTATDLLVLVVLYIRAPRQVNAAGVQTTLLKLI
jgi:hypothetical protein